MGFLSKIWRGVKKVFKKIGKGVKKVFAKIGKFADKFGVVGQIGLMLIPGHRQRVYECDCRRYGTW